MKPSGVQLASPMRPPLRTTRDISAAAFSWFGVNMTPKVEHGVEAAVAEGQRLGIRLLEGDGQALGGGAFAAALEQRVDVIRRGHVRESPRRGERRVAVAGGDVEHALARAQVDRLAQAFADDLQRGADDGVVAGGPHRLLALLDGGVIGFGKHGRHGRLLREAVGIGRCWPASSKSRAGQRSIGSRPASAVNSLRRGPRE